MTPDGDQLAKMPAPLSVVSSVPSILIVITLSGKAGRSKATCSLSGPQLGRRPAVRNDCPEPSAFMSHNSQQVFPGPALSNAIFWPFGDQAG